MTKQIPANSGSDERRSAVRYECDQPASCHLMDSNEDLFAKVHNISDTGIGLSLGFPFDPETSLIVELQGLIPAESLPLAARVVHSTSKPDGSYLVGCEFDTRSDIELDSRPDIQLQ